MLRKWNAPEGASPNAWPNEKYGDNEWEKRESEKYPYVWVLGGRRIQAKNFEEKTFRPIPLSAFGVR